MIVLEIAAANRILERVNRWTVPLFRLVGLSEAGAFPVVVATFFGLTFGSGVIISYIGRGGSARGRCAFSACSWP